MKSLLLTLTILVISTATFASDIDVSGKWAGVYGTMGTMTYEFLVDGNKLYGTTIGEGDSRIDIVKGKVKTSKKRARR
jgi:hypothetical protein